MAKTLAERHGMEAPLILQKGLKAVPAAVRDVHEKLWCVEARHAVEQTMCMTLTDFYFRRTPLVLARKDHGLPFAPSIAQVMGELLGWNESQTQEQINALQNQIARELSSLG